MVNQESQSTDSLICKILSEGVDEHEDTGNRDVLGLGGRSLGLTFPSVEREGC